MLQSRERALKMPGEISLKKITLGAGIGLAVAFVAALVAAALISTGKLAPQAATLSACTAVFLGGLVGGALSGGRRRLLVTAGLTVLLMLAVLAVVGLAAFGGIFSTKMFVIVLILLAVSCILGSVIASFFKR